MYERCLEKDDKTAKHFMQMIDDDADRLVRHEHNLMNIDSFN